MIILSSQPFSGNSRQKIKRPNIQGQGQCWRSFTRNPQPFLKKFDRPLRGHARVFSDIMIISRVLKKFDGFARFFQFFIETPG